MAPRLADLILQVFDVRADAYEFLVDVLEHRTATPYDLKALFDQRLIACDELRHYQVDHARNIDGNTQTPASTDNRDDPSDPPWEATDRLIKQAKSLARKATDGLLLGPHNLQSRKTDKIINAAKRKTDTTSSHYWCQNGVNEDDVFASAKRLRMDEVPNTFISRLKIPTAGLQPSCVYSEEPNGAQLSSVHSAGTSPYFATPAKAPQPSSQRPSPGTVSCIPFPPLSAESFGIIQEEVAHDPFWLLIVVTFLIKTKGAYAIPTFLRVKERFPAPCDIANPDNAVEILSMIRHLGLGQNRLTWMKKYAQHFMFNPPRPGVRHVVRRYDAREVGRHDADGRCGVRAEDAATDGWEIGHMTQGAYAIDSWRIFCRDVLLGRAQDWNGKGARGEFQPEWMRVLPADKELRAFLRWMWMREGWEWDPATGERAVLREDMYRAVEEGRVEYDIYGGLQIVGERD